MNSNNNAQIEDSYKVLELQDAVDSTSVKIILIPPRSWYSKRVTLRSFIEKYATQDLNARNIDFELVKIHTIPKQRSPFHDNDDKSIWDAQEAIVENMQDKSVKLVVIARRLFLPPFGEDYQDIIFDVSIPREVNKASRDEKMKQIYDSVLKCLTPMPQCFLFDTLCLRAKLESLRGDEDFYVWVQRSFKLKPELLPIHVKNPAEALISRPDLMIQAIANQLHFKDVKACKGQENTIVSVWDVEQELYKNVDSPDTIKNPTVAHAHNFRAKLARYMAYYADGACTETVNLKRLFEQLTDARDQASQAVIRLMNYFLHLRVANTEYKFQSLNDQIFELEDVIHAQLKDYMGNNNSNKPSAISGEQQEEEEGEPEDTDFVSKYKRYKQQLKCIRENCGMNIQVFVKLFRLGYFNCAALRLPPAS